MDKQKIWILYICTWQYTTFRKDFYLSAQQYFLRDHKIHYFVFTDANEIFGQDDNDQIHIIPHTHLGRPDATLMRFHTFLWAEDQLKKMDYIFFCNANLEIKQPIWEETLPSLDEWIVVTQHPWFYNKKNNQFTYEKNKKSTAYISQSEWKYYIAWGFNWWTSSNFLEMCKLLSKNIDKDKSQWIVAVWHDESYLNKYILDHNYKLLDPSYLYPEWRRIPFDCKILIRDKSKYIPVDAIKWNKDTLFSKINNIINYILKN